MKRLTVSITERQYYRIRARVRSGEASSKSDAVRQILDGYEDLCTEHADLTEERDELHRRCERLEEDCEDLKDERDELRERCDELKQDAEQAAARRDELRRQLQARETEETAPVETSNDAVGELVELIEEERRAGVVTRIKWWLFGRR
jgi:uncharacterized coiled-coil DUF342 family protein